MVVIVVAVVEVVVLVVAVYGCSGLVIAKLWRFYFRWALFLWLVAICLTLLNISCVLLKAQQLDPVFLVKVALYTVKLWLH